MFNTFICIKNFESDRYDENLDLLENEFEVEVGTEWCHTGFVDRKGNFFIEDVDTFESILVSEEELKNYFKWRS